MIFNTVLRTSARHISREILILALIAFWAQLLNAQLRGPKYDERLLFRGMTGIAVGGEQQSWKLDSGEKVVQQSAPVTISLPLSNRILITMTNSAGISKLDTMKLQGIGDTRVGFSYVVPGDKVWINGGVNVPTGITKLTASQLRVATILSQTAFGYRMPVYGQGINGNFGFAYAYTPRRRLVVGFGASYLYKGEYQPSSIGGSTDKYDPGDEISLNAGLDYTTFSKSERFSADATVTNYLPDKVNGQNFIQSGLRVMTMMIYSLKWGPTSHMIHVRMRLRTQSQIFSADSTQKFKSSQHYEFQYSASWFAMPWCTLSGIAEGKVYTGDQIPIGLGIFETGKAQIVSVGADAGIALFSSFTISLNAKYGTGSVVIDNIKNSVTGLEFGGGARFQF